MSAARFQGCSIGKLVTATLVMRLVERGVLTLETSVARWFPDYPNATSMTIDHVLLHTMRYGRGLMLYDVAAGPGLMIGHSGGMQGFRAIVAYVPAEPAYVAVMFNDHRPAEAGLWALLQAARGMP